MESPTMKQLVILLSTGQSIWYVFRFSNIVDDSFLVDQKMWLHKACYLDSHFFCLQIVLQLVCNKVIIPPYLKKRFDS